MTKKLHELLRQGEKRIFFILDFSKELDKKIYNLLILILLLACLLTSHFISIFLFALSMYLMTGLYPLPYKGAGLPLSEFDDEKTIEEIIQRSRYRYETRFERNKELNSKKSKILKISLILFQVIIGIYIVGFIIN
tara:strand:+ start:896 stop:1303 length:408 start_codon:yes stop_codon:yes gene_type:complete